MALELNGTTGVSLVQDGVVTAADLASTLDLSGKTVTLPVGSGGKVLQMVSNQEVRPAATSETHVSAGNYFEGVSVGITPMSSNSYIMLEYNPTTLTRSAQANMGNNNSQWFLQEIGGTNYFIKNWSNYGDSNWPYGFRQDRTLRYVLPNSTTSQRTFRFYMYQVSGVATIPTDDNVMYITATEYVL